MCTAHPGAVGAIWLPGPHALDKNGSVERCEGRVLFNQFAIEFEAGNDSVIGPVTVFARGQGSGARCHDSHAVLDGLLVAVVLKGCLKIPHKPLHIGQGRVQVNPDQIVSHNLPDQAGEFYLNILSADGLMKMPGLTP